MPVYNVEKYLCECLDSLLAQTMKDFEMICVDDGSTDSSPNILVEYKEKFEDQQQKFEIVRLEHSNAGHARNVGMQHATGDYLS